MFVLLLLTSVNVTACKDRLYPNIYPNNEISGYDYIAVLKISAVKYANLNEKSRYALPFSFDAVVIKSIKGNLKKGDMLSGITSSGQSAHARCPISLNEGETYILMMNGKSMPYTTPRYGSLYVSSNDMHFNKYIKDIKSRLN